MENVDVNRLSDNKVDFNLMTTGDKMPQMKRNGCLSFLQRAWGKLTETKNFDDLDSLELYYLLGQCGNQIGGALWPSILEEYRINLTEEKCQNEIHKCSSKDFHHTNESFNSFFDISSIRRKDSSYSTLSDLERNDIKARVLCIDMEDSVVSRFTNSDLKFLFDKKAMITNYPGSANNWAEGYYSHGRRYRNKIMKSVMRYAEGCDNLRGFLLLYSVGGGTGSGLGSHILEQLEDHFSDIDRFVTCVYSTGSEDVITAPYNMMLATQHLIQYATCVLPVENRALQEISIRKNITPTGKFSSISSTFEDMNSIVVNLLLNVTSGSRFTGQMNFDVNAIKTNMVPYPKMHFLEASFSPICANDCPRVSSNATREKNFLNACSKDNQMLKHNTMEKDSALVAAMLFGRGDYSLTEMRKYLKIFQKKAPFLDWSGKCTKLGLCDVPPVGHNFSMLALLNSTAITSLFDCMSSKYQMLLTKKAHTHHYTNIQGFEYDFFYECQNTVADITEMYEEIKMPDYSTTPRLRPNIDYKNMKINYE